MARARNYFWGKAPGLNADIERHRAHEQVLRARIAELEAKTELTEMDQRVLETWRHFLCKLQDSRAEVVNQLGRKRK